MGLFDGLFGGEEDGNQTVKSEPWSKAQPYLLDLLKQAQATYQNQPMRSWGMLSPAERMQAAQSYFGADMLGTPMPGYEPPPVQPTPTPQPTAPQPQGGPPQGMLTKDQLRAMGPASGGPVMVYDPSDGVVMMKPDGAGNWIRDIGALKHPSSGRGGSGAEESGRASTSYAANQGQGYGGTNVSAQTAVDARGGYGAYGQDSVGGWTSPGAGSGTGWGGMMSGGTLGGIVGGMLGLAAGGPAGAIGGGMLGNRFGNWMSGGGR